MSLLKRALLLLLVCVSGLLAVALVRSFSLTATPSEPLAPLVFANASTDAAARRLAGALRFPTISSLDGTDPEPFHRFQDYLAGSFPKAHEQLSLERVGELSLLYHWPGRDAALEPVILLAHQDVVPIAPGSLERWRYPPFSGTLADGAIWGRGAMDDKSGVVGILEAVEQLLVDGFQPHRSVYLAFGHDEELGGERGAAVIARLLADRGVRAALVLDEGGVITQGRVKGVERPLATVGIAEKGYLSLELVATSRGGHSSMPPAQTSVGIVAAAVARLEANPFPARIRGATRRMLEHLAPAMPFGQRLAMSNIWLFEPILVAALSADPGTAAMLRTTTAATMFSGSNKDNVLPSEARAVVNFRIRPGESVVTVTDRVRGIIDDSRVELQALPGASDPTAMSNPDSSAFRLVREAIRASSTDAVVVAPFLVVGGTDAKHYAGVSDQLLRFSGYAVTDEELGGFHGVDERIRISEYARVVRFYTTVLANLDRLDD